MTRTVSIAACQIVMRPVSSFDDFAAHMRGLLDDATGADLVLFPEGVTSELISVFPDWEHMSVSELTRFDEFTGEYTELFQTEARKRDQYIAAGSHLVWNGGRYVNVAYLFEPNGAVHTHAKTHIFPLEAEYGTAEGNEMRVIDLPFGRVGFNICYEIEIPECAAALTEQGVEIILCPSCTVTEHGFWRVRHCAQARCIENQVFAVHCGLGGDLGEPVAGGWTRSSILSPCDFPWSPDGVVAEAEPNLEMVIHGVVDLDELHLNRQIGSAPTYRDRRRRAALYANWPSHTDLRSRAETPA